VILILPGNRVSLIGARPGILAILPLVEGVWAALGLDCLLLSGTDGAHGPGSLHPAPHGLALDSIGWDQAKARLASVDDLHRADELLRRGLPSAGFDVCPEVYPRTPKRNHLHVERDPKKRPLELWESGGA
jgi:hypothetical protein